MDAGKLFVAAIDFGTTYSGYAFSTKRDKSIYTHDWQNGDLTSMKTPTSVLLDKDEKFKAFGYEADKIYLSTILPDEEMHKYYYFRRFKMMLLKEKMTSDSEIEEQCGKKMKAIDVFSISIKYLKDQAYNKIKSRFTGVKGTDIQYVLTVPAIWADQAKLFMRKAAEKAGILSDQLTLALEPEAASIFCQELKTDIEEQTHSFMETIKSGMKFMVIDLGGGTAYITVHQRHSDDTLDEILPASGGPWGGTAVDQAYVDFLHALFSKDVLEGLRKDDLEDYFQLFHEFEVKKRSIKDTSETNIIITMPVGLMDMIKKTKGDINDKKNKTAVINEQIKKTKYKSSVYAEGQKLHINPATFRSLFHQTIQRLLAHLDNLFKDRELSNLKNVIMVGGFSECELVQHAVKDKFGENKQIIIPDESGVAVLKGAVLFGHQPKAIKKRILSKTYGIQSWPEWDSDMHPETKKVFINDTERCKDVFFKFATKGDKVEDGHSNSQVFQALKPDENTLECVVYISDDPNPKFITDPSCQRLGNLVVDLPPLGKGESLEIEETMIFGGSELLFRAKELKRGRFFEVRLDF